MKLIDAFNILIDFKAYLQAGVFPTLKAILREPSLLLRPTALSRTFMSHVWTTYGIKVDESGRVVKQGLITPYATGVVLDVGAGHGHSVSYFDRTKVTKYVALEPNVLMHEYIRAEASKAGYHESDGTLAIISCGAEDTTTILSALGDQVDTVLSILTLCTIPSPKRTLSNLVRDVHKSGGQFLFYEHVLSPVPDVAWWQRFWAPMWQIPTDGCRIDRPSHLWVQEMGVGESEGVLGVWSEGELWGKEGEAGPESNLFWHRVGRFVKR